MPTRRCVLLFSRAPEREAAAKRLPGGSALFALAARRLRQAAARLPGVDLVEPAQRGSGFAERLLNAFHDARRLGYTDVVAVPCDVPGLGPGHLAAAFAALSRAPVVLGPSPDGGVYLIGAAGQVDLETLFRHVRWRTRHVTGDLRAAAPRGTLLDEAIPDVDGRADLVAIRDSGLLDPVVSAIARVILARSGPPAPATRLPLPAAPGRVLNDRSPPAAGSVA